MTLRMADGSVQRILIGNPGSRCFLTVLPASENLE
jgi:hypothetical protein